MPLAWIPDQFRVQQSINVSVFVPCFAFCFHYPNSAFAVGFLADSLGTRRLVHRRWRGRHPSYVVPNNVSLCTYISEVRAKWSHIFASIVIYDDVELVVLEGQSRVGHFGGVREVAQRLRPGLAAT